MAGKKAEKKSAIEPTQMPPFVGEMLSQAKAELMKEVDERIAGVEERLFDRFSAVLDRFSGAIEGINSKIEERVSSIGQEMGSLVRDQSEAMFKANATALVESVKAGMEEKAGALMAGGNNSSNGLGLGMIIDRLLDPAHLEAYAKVASAIRPPPSTAEAVLTQLGFSLRLHTLMSKMEKGAVEAEEISKTFSEILPQK